MLFIFKKHFVADVYGRNIAMQPEKMWIQISALLLAGQYRGSILKFIYALALSQYLFENKAKRIVS